jgi:hypothetical protein
LPLRAFAEGFEAGWLSDESVMAPLCLTNFNVAVRRSRIRSSAQSALASIRAP